LIFLLLYSGNYCLHKLVHIRQVMISSQDDENATKIHSHFHTMLLM
jgi:hypothetical protein